MLQMHLITTINQKVLGLLAKFSDEEFYEREVARKLGISTGSANRSLNGLYSTGAVLRRREGKMYFYSIDSSNAASTEFKKMVNLMLVEPLIEELKKMSNRIILYGSCALGTDTSESDLDLFVVSSRKEDVANAIGDFKFPKGFENIHIQSVIRTPVELLESGESERTFIEEVDRGILLWEMVAGESRV
ncbi:MAG: nucleotidyltransferase domain-containing protein [Dehalococcoidales bacterium]|nr:nucleotidyltransferase domain-containing protein [Dehalococcoidales bacterium]